jgi:hypothetical protein
MLGVPFVLLAAAVAILGGVIATAMGRGGELTIFHRDLPPNRFWLRSAADVVLLRLPTAFFGYQQQATSDVLREIAGLLASRDAEIASLRDEVWRLSAPVSTGPASQSTSSELSSADPVLSSTGPVPVEPGGGAVDREGAPDPQPPPL